MKRSPVAVSPTAREDEVPADLPPLQQRGRAVLLRPKDDLRHRTLHARRRFSLLVAHERGKRPIPPGIL